MYSPYLARIDIYPIKSLDRVALNEARILRSGALEGDRQFAIIDRHGKWVNGKRTPKVHGLRLISRDHDQTLSIQIEGSEQVIIFDSAQENTTVENWLGDYFGFPVTLVQNDTTGFPDDTNAPGPTVISTATIETVASWYPHLQVDELRRRLRTNLEIGGVPPFWEDYLFTEANHCVQFQIGKVLLHGVNPCQRCVVPTRDSRTGTADSGFQKVFVSQRRASLPAWAARSRFNHFYRLAVNTRLSEVQGDPMIRTGDTVAIKGIVTDSIQGNSQDH